MVFEHHLLVQDLKALKDGLSVVSFFIDLQAGGTGVKTSKKTPKKTKTVSVQTESPEISESHFHS